MKKENFLNITKIKQEFPLLKRTINSKPIVFLDSGATSQKPQFVLDAMTDYYEEINANVHRGAYQIAEQATTASENARKSIA